jgi:acetylornithine aminotransferase
MDNVFFGNSGAEANECAIKIARMFASHKGISQPKIITTEHSFHGRTLATLSATGNPKVQKGFEPLVSGFVQVPYNDIAAVERLSNDPDIVAIMIEPVQGEGGVNVPADDYLNSIRALCNKNDWLLIADEIQTGIARTGQWFAYQHADITPDVVTSAKALGNGVPIGACLTHGKAAKLLQAGNHGSTYGGNPLSTSVAKKVLEIIERDGLVKQAEIQGAKLLQSLKARLLAHEKIKDIRGLGMMVGIELDQDCADLMKRGIDRGVLVNVTQGHVVRLLPALNMSDSQLDDLIDKICSLIEDYLAE